MDFLLWHGLAITTVIAIAFVLGYVTGKQQTTYDNNKNISKRK